MTIDYYPETDSLYIALRAGSAIETIEIADGVKAEFDAAGSIVGFDIDGASRKRSINPRDKRASVSRA